jgi:tRNA(Ile2) C34 agmatinyltransferase TiaS
MVTRHGVVKTSSEVASCILNLVCPECGGRMGGYGSEFKCQGECQADWRDTWDLLSSSRH